MSPKAVMYTLRAKKEDLYEEVKLETLRRGSVSHNSRTAVCAHSD